MPHALPNSAGSGVGATPASRDTEVPGVALAGFYGRKPTVRDALPERRRPPRSSAIPAPSKAEQPAQGGDGG